jgi:hypothetical protein
MDEGRTFNPNLRDAIDRMNLDSGSKQLVDDFIDQLKISTVPHANEHVMGEPGDIDKMPLNNAVRLMAEYLYAYYFYIFDDQNVTHESDRALLQQRIALFRPIRIFTPQERVAFRYNFIEKHGEGIRAAIKLFLDIVSKNFLLPAEHPLKEQLLELKSLCDSQLTFERVGEIMNLLNIINRTDFGDI